MNTALTQLEELLGSTEIPDFRLQSFDSVNLLLIGSFDLAYYHQVEVLFHEVSYLACPTTFSDASFRLATPEEVDSLSVALAEDDQAFAIECDGGQGEIVALIVAEHLSVLTGKVYHYEREDLSPGERVADWVSYSEGRPTPPEV